MMRKIIFLLVLFSFYSFGQDLFVGKDKNEYLFIGSKEGNNIKLLNIKNHSVLWRDKNLLQQIDRLQPKNFLQEISKAKMFFSANGDEPFWKATISEHEISFLGSNIDSEHIAIQMDINKSSIDYMFLLMFHATNNPNIYGVIRGLSVDSMCDLNLDEEQSIFEVFINYEGDVVKGCATLMR